MKNKWQTKKLGELCQVVGGGTPKTSDDQFWADEVAWVTPKDLGVLQDFEINSSVKMISQEGLRKSSAQLLPAGSVILSSRAPIGYVAIAGVEMATSQGCRSFVCGEEINNKFLYYFLIKNRDFLNSLGGGSTFREVSGSKLKEIIITYPSIPEQKKIVKKLDEIFDKTAKVKENLEKNLMNISDLRASVLSQLIAS